MSQLTPYFHITPAIRFLVTLFNAEQVDPTGARQSVFIKVIPLIFMLFEAIISMIHRS